jgi:PAS domain S-box-containing protein
MIAAMERLFLLLFLGASVAPAQTNDTKNVLILMQEDISWPAFRLIDENTRAVLRSDLPAGSLVFSEHLDRVHFPNPEFQAQQLAGIRRKYANARIDLIIGVGDVPTDLFPGVPMLYVRTDPLPKRPNSSDSSKDLVNLWIELDAKRTLDAARHLQPEARQVVVIGSNSTTGKNLVAQVRDQISSDSGGLSIIYLSNLTFDQICQKVSTLGPESIVLFVSLSQDGAGRPFISADVVPKISAISGTPVYGVLDTQIGSGALGGFVVRFAEMGKRAGEIGVQMLAGEHPEDQVVRSDYLFDWRQVHRWKISESALPAGSLVLYRQPSLWESFRYYIIAAILFGVIQTLLILGLLWQQAKSKKLNGFEKILSNLSATFINLPEEQVAKAIEKSLGRIAGFLKINRITLFGYSQERRELEVTFSWHSRDDRPVPSVIKVEELSWMTNLLLLGKTVTISDLDTLPEEASADREHLRKFGAISVAAVPLKAGDHFFGAISFIRTKRRMVWTEELVEQLKLVAEIFSNALMRQRALDARFRHAAIVESSDDAIVSKNMEGIIASWNAAAQRLYGYSEDEVLGNSITILIPCQQQPEQLQLLQRLKDGGRVEHHETVRVAKGGQIVPVSLTISTLRDSKGAIVGFSEIARDISDRKRGELLLRESEERFRLVANTAPVLIWMSGADKLCNFFNQGWLSFTGRSLEDQLGNGWTSGVHPEDLKRCIDIYSSSFDARVDFEMEYRLLRFDGEYRWIVDYGVPRFEPDGSFCGYIGSCVDITDRKLAAESLHTLTGRLIHAQEEERTRIARELHDDFNQRLALQCIDIDQLRKKLPDLAEGERVRLARILQRTKTMSADIRSLSHGLHSSRLEYIGLLPALSGLCKEVSEKYKIDIRFSENELSVDIPKEVALCLFRVTQEALANVVKHSRAASAYVELDLDEGTLRLRILDQGTGFDPSDPSRGAGIGLVGMTERLRLVGGKLSIRSEALRGTEVLAEVPVQVETEERARTMSAGGSKL